MTDEQRAAITAALAKRKAAKDAYDVARERIEPLRMAWVDADKEYAALMRAQNTTAGKVWRD